jgi:trimethylamine:corrinoid methyltransferase-like protein
VRHSFEEWEKSGRTGLAENAQAKAELILAEHMVPPLEDSQERELEKIIQKAEDNLVKK